jgi:hypothetical protein
MLFELVVAEVKAEPLPIGPNNQHVERLLLVVWRVVLLCLGGHVLFDIAFFAALHSPHYAEAG